MKSYFYRNPRLIVLTIGLILVAGLSSFYVMPRMEDPLLTERIGLVNTRFPGADADRVESQVTEKLEDELREIEEIKEIRSVSRAGISTITIELRDDTYQNEVDAVWSRVRDKLDDAKFEMPEGVMDPVFDRIDMKANAMLIALSWTQDDEPNYAILRRRAEELEDQLRALSGTEKVDFYGEPEEEILIEVNPDKLAAIGLSVPETSRRIRESDSKVAAGQLRNDKNDVQFEVKGELDSLGRIRNLPIQLGEGRHSVRVGQIADVKKGIVTPPRDSAIVRGRPAIVIGVLGRDGIRIDHWTTDIHKTLASFEKQLPRGVELKVIFEQNQYVETRLENLLLNLLMGGGAVTLVILLMMGWRSAVIVASSLPLAGLMVLTGMRFLDIPIHQMSVTGLIIALGLLIDNAIVVVDEVRERLREGLSRIDAVSKSVSHLAIPLTGSTLTTAFAFAPIALMPGPAGEFVGSIAVSVVLAIFSSLFLAMTLVPALTAMMRASGGQLQRRVWWRDGFSHQRLTGFYRSTLRALFARPALGIVLGLLLPVIGFWQGSKLPEQFFPPSDRDQIQIELELNPSASLAQTRTTAMKVRERLLQHDQVESVDWFLGQSAPTFYYNVIRRREGTPQYAQAMIQLKSKEGSRDVIRELQKELDHDFPEARILVRQLEQGPPFDAPVEVRLYGPDPEVLRRLGKQTRLILSQTPDVIHVQSEMEDTNPRLSVVVDEEEARTVGLSLNDVAAQLNGLLEGSVGGSMLEGTEELKVRVRVSNSQRGDLSGITSLDLMPGSTMTPSGDYVGIPPQSFSKYTLKPETANVPHLNGRKLNEIKVYITAGVLPAQVLNDFKERLEKSGFELPPGYTLDYGGEAAKRNDAVGNLMANVGVLMVMMIATLVLSFRSFRLAGIIGIVGVLSVGLGLGALSIFGYPFGFMAIIGTMGLVGVAINDAIVVLAALREDAKAKARDVDAITDVVMRSTRHVLATSLTTMIGFLPLVLSGGGFWPPLAVAISGGVGGATVLALYFVPSMYLLVASRSQAPTTDSLQYG